MMTAGCWRLAVLIGWVAVASGQSCLPVINVHSYCGSTSCAPEDRLVGNPTDNCRTNEFFAPDHILPEGWELMFDSYDYQDLLGSVFLDREFDNDGTGVSNKAVGNNNQMLHKGPLIGALC